MNVLTPRTLEEALKGAAEYPRYRLVAGGSDLIPALKRGGGIEGMIVLRNIDVLGRITIEPEQMRIGAAVSVSQLQESAMLCEWFPILNAAAAQFGSRQIRNVATVGGNIAHASPAADLVPALLVLDARIEIMSTASKRRCSLDELIRSPGTTALEEGEIITSIVIPRREWNTHYYRKIGRRSALNISVASLAALGRQKRGEGWEVRLSGASLSPSPRRMVHVEALFADGVPEREAVLAALKRDIDPHSGLRGSAEYRLAVTANMILEFADALDG